MSKREPHALFENRDVVFVIIRHVHPEVHDDDKAVLLQINKLFHVCTNEAVKANAFASMLPVLRRLDESVTQKKVEQLVERFMSSTRASDGCLRFSFKYILNCHHHGPLAEHMQNIVSLMAQNLLVCNNDSS